MSPSMEEFDRYMAYLGAGLGHVDRMAAFRGYCEALLSRGLSRSVEPRVHPSAPMLSGARYQALHHFVAEAAWCDEQLLLRVGQWVLPHFSPKASRWWHIDSQHFPKQGQHSVGVARQCPGVPGKPERCQVAVSLSLTNAAASLPLAWRLYLPPEWVDDMPRRERCGVPEAVDFRSRSAIALAQLAAVRAQGAPAHCVLADAAYGGDPGFRQGVSDQSLPYLLGLPRQTLLSLPDGSGRARTASELARAAQPGAWQHVVWFENEQVPRMSRFARWRVRCVLPDGSSAPATQWLLVEWAACALEPVRFWLSTLSEDTSLEHMVHGAKLGWRTECDQHDMRTQLGLGHYEGRGWRGFHHHASLSIAAYGFLLYQRLARARALTGPVAVDAPAGLLPVSP